MSEMIIDNFSKIRDILKFKNPGDFYVVHVMFRVKDLRNDEEKQMYLSHDEQQRLIKTYYVDSLEYFDKKKPAMIDLAEKNKARVYIIPTRKNRITCNRIIAKKIIDFIDDPNIRYDHLIRSAVCGCHISDYKWWVIDIDKDEEIIDPNNIGALSRIRLYDIKDEIEMKVRDLVNETKVASGCEVFDVPTKNGIHILTPPFNKSKLACLGDRIKTDGMTLLYYNDEA